MNSDKSHSNREQLEAKLTALLLGELPADEAERLSRAIEHDPALTKLHERLKQTVVLVKEASTSPQEPALNGAEPLKLDEKRRQELLARFKTVTPKEFSPKNRKRQVSVLLVGAAAAVVVLAALSVVLNTESFSSTKRISEPQRSVQQAAQLAAETAIESAKEQILSRKALSADGTSAAKPIVATAASASSAVQPYLPSYGMNNTQATLSLGVEGGNSYSKLPSNGRGDVLSAAPNAEHATSLFDVPSAGPSGQARNYALSTSFGSGQTPVKAPAPPKSEQPSIPSATTPESHLSIVLPSLDGFSTADKPVGGEQPGSQTRNAPSVADNSGSYAILADSFTIGGLGGGAGGGGGGAGQPTAAGNIALNWDEGKRQAANDGLGDIGGERSLRRTEELQTRNDFGLNPAQSTANPAAAMPPPPVTPPLARPAPAVDPATGLPVGSGPIIDPATGLPLPVETPTPVAATASNEKLVAQTIKLEPSLFKELASIPGSSVDDHLGRPEPDTRTAVPRVSLSGSSGAPPSGILAVTRTNGMSQVQDEVRKFFTAAGVDLDSKKGKSIFYNDREGTLLVRGTEQDLDGIQKAVDALNTPPPKVSINAKFAETSQTNANGVLYSYDPSFAKYFGSNGVSGEKQLQEALNKSMANLDTGITREDLFESKRIAGEANGKEWSDPLHQKQGNVGLADGSVSQASRARLQEALKNSGNVNKIQLPTDDVSGYAPGPATLQSVSSPQTSEGLASATSGDNKAKAPELGLRGAMVTNSTFSAGKDWNFPAPSVTNAGSLARVERGGAWQTVFLSPQEDAKNGQVAKNRPRTISESEYRLALNDRERTVRDRTIQDNDGSTPQTTPDEIMDLAEAGKAEKPTLGAKLRGLFSGQTERKARIKVERDQSDISGPVPQGANGYDPYFVQNEFETIQSDAVLGKVVKDLDLNRAWAKKGDGKPLDDSQAIALLKKKLDLRPVRNTSFVEIGAKGQNGEEAAKLANAVANAYKEHRAEQQKEVSFTGFSVAKEQLAQNQLTTTAEATKEFERLHQGPQTTNATVAAKEIDEPLLRKPAPDAPVPQPEIVTADNAFSTFSLNVSDVSFKLAAASLEQGAMPEANSVRTEEFINAFDYRDPEPSAGIPVAFAWERARYPFAQNRDLVRFSLKTAAAGRQPGKPMNIVLLMDNSGSMERADRVTIIREALKVLAAQLRPEDKFSIVTFSRTARLAVDGVAGNEAAQATETVGGLTPEGGTNLEEAMRLAYETALRHYQTNGINRVVLLTDGAANLGDVEPESLKQKVEANRKQGIALDCFGIGWEGYNDDLLEVLSRNGDGRYGFINTPEEAATEFVGKLAGALQVAASDVKVQVEFNPKRVTVYRQLGYAKHQLTKEQFRDNTVDAAELGAAEAGNALYVLEINPAGTGALGTVHVRYKVPGTSDYREQEWALPYNGTAVALDQASPALKLAASASAFSEWLVASPYAGEVTPDALLGYLRGVPEVYGADGRPKKLEWMIRQAKSVAGH